MTPSNIERPLRVLSPHVGERGRVDLPVVMTHLKGEPIRYASLSPKEALALAVDLIRAAAL